MQKLVVVALNSLLAAGLYATMSYGLAVIYGVMRIINLAHAGLMMLAAYVDLCAERPVRDGPVRLAGGGGAGSSS